MYYTEKLEVGYRWYHARNVKPKFAFGHGLSYSSFTYTNIKATATVTGTTVVTATVANSGSVDGNEVPQLYLDFPASVGEPPRQLKGFTKIFLAKGASKEVAFSLSARDKSLWSVATHSWERASGTFIAHVGASSDDLRLSTSFTI